MTNSSTDIPILDDDAVAEIERVASGSGMSTFPMTTEEALALCQTVRALRAENEKLKASRRVHELDNHHNALACGYCAGPLKDELTRLQRLQEQEAKQS